MINLILSFISCYLGFGFSPQSPGILLEGFPQQEVWIQYLLMVFGIWGASCVNGYNHCMLARSKLDFVVNVVVSSIVGSGLALFLLYLLRFSFVGRWVLLLSIVYYSVLVYLYSYIGLICFPWTACIVSDQKERLEKLFRDVVGCGRGANNEFYDVSEVLKEIFHGNWFEKDRRASYAIVSDGLGDQAFDIIKKGAPKLLAVCFPLEHIVEEQLEVVDVTTVSWRTWACVPTRLRGSSFGSLKRILELLVIMIISVPALLIVILAGVAIKITDRGPVFYRQVRLGQFRKEFLILKLRTMRVDSEADGAQWAKIGDRRVTFVGGILRKTRIDELPQLWNILRGDMALIGPRPERPEFYSVIEREVPKFGLRVACKPGLTGWAQVNYPYGSSVDDARMKLSYDLYYIKRYSLMLDMRIMTRTIVAMVKGAR
jgi:lipopolysaccharide/colanic/teichoic acid biosynthesis glycosyltransferase